jgi:hypothetical protein
MFNTELVFTSLWISKPWMMHICVAIFAANIRLRTFINVKLLCRLFVSCVRYRSLSDFGVLVKPFWPNQERGLTRHRYCYLSENEKVNFGNTAVTFFYNTTN